MSISLTDVTSRALDEELRRRASKGDEDAATARKDAGDAQWGAEYYATVRAIVQEATTNIADGTFTSTDDLETYLHESVDGNYWVIYYHAAYRVPLLSNHDDAWEDAGLELPTEHTNVPSFIAYWALLADVRDRMTDGEGWDLDDDTTWPANRD